MDFCYADPVLTPNTMFKKALRLLVRDRAAFRWHVKMKWLKWRASRFAQSGFSLQGKMDIDPSSWWHNPEFLRVTGGFCVPGDAANRSVLELEPWDGTRRDMIILLLRSLVERGITGDLAEVGVYKGNTARLIHHYLPERNLYLFDTFAGFDGRDVQAEMTRTGRPTSQREFSDTSLELVLKNIHPQNTNVQVFPGYFPESAPPSLDDRVFAFVHLDADLYEPILAGLQYFYGKMTGGGFILVHDFNSWLGARRAVCEFFKDKPEVPIPMPDKSGSALIVKQAGPPKDLRGQPAALTNAHGFPD